VADEVVGVFSLLVDRIRDGGTAGPQEHVV
jgi:hypothetical protein